MDPSSPGALVPATVVEDTSLPSELIEVAGIARRIHLRRYGDPEAPVLVVLPGAACDMRSYMALEALSDAWQVVFFDLRGNGLSERVSEAELAFDLLPEEFEAVKELVSPDAPIRLLGHSWSAAMAAMYLGRYPESVAGAILVEPPALTPADQADTPLDVNIASEEYLDLVWSNRGPGPADHAWLDFKTLGVLRRGVKTFLCDPDDPPVWPVWRPGGLALLVWQSQVLKNGHFSYDFTVGLEDYAGPVLLVGTECSAIGTEFQTRVNAPLFQDVTLLHIADSGHRVPVEQPEALIAGIRAWLETTR